MFEKCCQIKKYDNVFISMYKSLIQVYKIYQLLYPKATTHLHLQFCGMKMDYLR